MRLKAPPQQISITNNISSEPFSGYENCHFPDPRKASLSEVKTALRQIIEKDGPLTKASLFQLYVKGCPSIYRIGKAVKSTLDKLLRSMQRTGEIVIEDELGDGSPQSKVIRLAGTPKVRERPAGHRDLLEIPASELFFGS